MPIKYTSDEYVAIGGVRCPACGSDDISIIDSDSSDIEHWQEVRCDTCRARWTDSLKLTGYDNLEDADGNPIGCGE